MVQDLVHPTSDSEETDSKFFRHFCRHLVGLAVTFSHRSVSGEWVSLAGKVYSATIFDVNGVYSILTAGHVLAEIQNAAENGVRIDGCFITDPRRDDDRRWPAIPIPKENVLGSLIVDTNGLDFGLVLIPNFVGESLKQTGVQPISMPYSVPCIEDLGKEFFLLGFPEELNLQNPNDKNVFHMTTCSIPLIVGEDTYDDSGRFVSTINDSLNFSIVGMSGGPIIGFSSQQTDRYWIVALQSSWNKSSLTIYGTPISTIVGLIEKWIREATEQV